MQFHLEADTVEGRVRYKQTPSSFIDDYISLQVFQEENGVSLAIKALQNLDNPVVFISIPFLFKKQCRIGTNGYQTWTFSTERKSRTQQKGLARWTKPLRNKYNLEQYGDYHFRSYHTQAGQFRSYHFLGIVQDDQTHYWQGLDEDDGFIYFETRPQQKEIRAYKDLAKKWPKGRKINLHVRWADHFVTHQVSSAALVKPGRKAAGWTSWYKHYTDINESIILENAHHFEKLQLPIDYFQIDDGWQKYVGEWTPNASFPNGMKAVATSIKELGFKPGLWLAPFIAEDACALPAHWFGKDADGRKIKAGFSPDWSGPFYALDISQEDVQHFVASQLEKAIDTWGFRMLKLDFLYALGLAVPQNRSRADCLSVGMNIIEQFAHKADILACGVPLKSAAGKVQYCRVSADIALQWEDRLLADIIRYEERVSTYAALKTSIFRSKLDGHWFANDPDVAILREGTKLSWAQKKCLFLVNQLFGSLQFVSDDPANYDEKSLRLYQSQFPLLDISMDELYQDGDYYTAICTAMDRSYRVKINLGKTPIHDIPAYSCVITSITNTAKIQIIDADDHILPGVSIDYTDTAEQIQLYQRFKTGVSPTYVIIRASSEIDINRISLTAEPLDKEQGIYRLNWE